jgi:endonuclease YncB( thermonuclease family)
VRGLHRPAVRSTVHIRSVHIRSVLIRSVVIGSIVIGSVVIGCGAIGCTWTASPLDGSRALDGGPLDHDAAGLDAGSARDAAPSTDALSADAISPDGAPTAVFGDPVAFDDDLVAAIDPSTLPAARSPCRAPVLARVTWATDGDTITVEPIDGAPRERVRMIGVDTPEVAHRAGEVDDCYGPEAHAFSRTLVDHLVWLTFDELCVDPYERTLAYVSLSPLPEGLWERQLLRRGLARALVIGRNRALETIVLADEARAREESRGLWDACR